MHPRAFAHSDRPHARSGLQLLTYGATGGTIRVVDKTTVYLPEDLKAAVKHAARQRGVSEAEVIRESIRAGVGDVKPRPRGGLYTGSEPIARRVDELLDGFGER